MKVSDAVTEIGCLERAKKKLREALEKHEGMPSDTIMPIDLDTALTCSRLMDMRLSLLNDCEVSEPNWLDMIDPGGVCGVEYEL